MKPASRTCRSTAPERLATRGFTLIELMVAVAIVGVLAAVAFPSYQNAVRKGRRAEAVNAVAAVQQAQERWRANHPEYANNLSNGATDTPPGLGISATTRPGGHFGLALSDVTGAVYVVTATAAGGQADDTACKLMAVRQRDGNLTYGSGTSAIDWADPGRCWAK